MTDNSFKDQQLIKEYEDEYHNIHKVDPTHELGRGGQGVVYRSEDENIAIKLVQLLVKLYPV